MKTTVQALKELYATLGGDLAEVALIERIPEMIEALNSIAVAVPAPTAEDKGKAIMVSEDGALGYADALPPVTAEDVGKVMTVSDQGAWEPKTASGGGAFIMVAYPVSSSTAFPLSGKASMNVFKFIDGHETREAVTKSDLKAAFEANIPVILYICKLQYGGSNYPSPFLIPPFDVHHATGDVSEPIMMIYTNPKTVQFVIFSNDSNNFYLNPVGSFDYT